MIDCQSGENSTRTEKKDDPSNEENLDCYKMYKECAEQNQELLDKLQGLLNKKFDLILEMSCLKKGEVFQNNAAEIKEEEVEVKVEEYKADMNWLVGLTKACRENVALLKRVHEMEQEIEEMSNLKNKLAAQVEYRSSLGEGKKMKLVPYDDQFSTSEESGCFNKLFGRLESRDFLSGRVFEKGYNERDSSNRSYGQMFQRNELPYFPAFTNISNRFSSLDSPKKCSDCGGGSSKGSCSSCNNKDYFKDMFGSK